MNILQQEDIIKGLPDDALMQEAQAPSGQVPQFLVVSEIQRRSDMRKRYQEQQQPQGTVAEQIVGQAQQGIAAMQPQAGPMPPQMPPQGMPPQMPPQGMPPQQMFSGGIIRLQGGGFLDQQSVERPFYPTRANAGNEGIMPRGMTVRDKIQTAIENGATMAELLSVFRNNPEAMQEIRMMYMTQLVPGDFAVDGSAIETSPQVAQGRPSPEMSSGDAGSQLNYFQPPDFLGDVVEAGVGLMPKMPSDQDMIDFYRGILPEAPERGAAEEAGRQFGERVRGGIEDLFDPERREGLREKRIAENVERSRQGLGFDPTEGSKGFFEYYSDGNRSVVDPSRRGAGAKRGGAEPQGLGGQMSRSFSAERQGQSDVQRQATSNAQSDGATLADQVNAFLDGQKGSDDQPTVPELSAAIFEAQDNLNDASSKDFSPASSPSLDLSDLVADAQRMTRANALMQLGAGIAAGDLSQGLSRAGVAAAQGDQRAKAIAIQERMAEYNAGRQDLDRRATTDFRNAQLKLAKDRMEAELAKAERVSAGQLLNFASDIAEEIVGDTIISGDREAQVNRIVNQLLRQYAPLVGLDPKTIPLVKNGAQTGPAGFRVVERPAQG